MSGAFKLAPRGTTVDINLPQQGDSEAPLTTVDANTDLLKDILVELRITNQILNEVYDFNVTQLDLRNKHG